MKLEMDMTASEQGAWSKVEKRFRSARKVQPHEGLASRWLLFEKKKSSIELKRRQFWLLLGNVAVILVLLGVIGVTVWSFFRHPNSLANIFSLMIKSVTDFVIAIRLWISSHHNFSLVAWFGTAWMTFLALSAISLLATMLVVNFNESSMVKEEVASSD